MNKKYFITVLLIFVASRSFSQITFEKGYFINETGQKVECLIKNVDWKKNPDAINYKLSEDGETLTESVTNIKEFAIIGFSKYVRANVEIDRSSNELFNMSSKRDPEFVREQLFLKVLIEGEATLYQYTGQNLERYFYKIDDNDIKQLVYKRYLYDNTKVSENKQFQQQLLNDLKCGDSSIIRVQYMNYYKKDLERYFNKYLECKNSEYFIYKGKKYDKFNLSLKPGVNYSRLLVRNAQSISSARKFDNEVSFRMGIEAEYILPFNKNKWGLILEPTYQSYKSEKDLTKVNYESIEVPFGIRYYMFLGKNSKLFMNGAFVFDFNNKKSLVDYDDRGDVEIDSFNNFAFGAGYKYHRFSAEIRYMTNRDLFNGYASWLSEFNTISAIFGITVF